MNVEDDYGIRSRVSWQLYGFFEVFWLALIGNGAFPIEANWAYASLSLPLRLIIRYTVVYYFMAATSLKHLFLSALLWSQRADIARLKKCAIDDLPDDHAQNDRKRWSSSHLVACKTSMTRPKWTRFGSKFLESW